MKHGTRCIGPVLGSCARNAGKRPDVAQKIQFTVVIVVHCVKDVVRSMTKTEPQTKLEIQASHQFFHEWHVAINVHQREVGHENMKFMYEAKSGLSELARLPYVFARERKGELPKIHQQCSHSAPVEMPENYLMCCLGKKCRECPILKAIDAMKGTDEEKDIAKAMTCVTHIISEGGDMMNEGFILDCSDRMFWDRVHENLAGSPFTEGEIVEDVD